MCVHVLTRQREVAPFGAVLRVELITDVCHPQIAVRAFFVEEPDAAGVTFGLIEERLHEDAEETIGVGLANEQIERELYGMALNLRHALGSSPLVCLVRQFRLERYQTKRLEVVGTRRRTRLGFRFHAVIMHRRVEGGIVRKSETAIR